MVERRSEGVPGLAQASRVRQQRKAVSGTPPSHARVALWQDKTLATDTAGTRIYSFIGGKTIEQRPGKWRVVLTVGGVERGAMTFTVTKP